MAFHKAVSSLEPLSLFGVEATHFYHRPRIRLKIVVVFNDLVTSRISYPASFIVCPRQARITYHRQDIDESAFGKRISNKILRIVAKCV